MTVLLNVVGFLSLMIGGTVWGGWVLSVLWGWFLVPTLGVPSIGVVQAMGVHLMMGFLTHQSHMSDRGDDVDFSQVYGFVLLNSLLFPATALVMGYAIQFFM